MLYEYLWTGKRDSVGRTAIINDTDNGGLNMVDINSFFMSLNTAWVLIIIKSPEKCDHCNGTQHVCFLAMKEC